MNIACYHGSYGFPILQINKDKELGELGKMTQNLDLKLLEDWTFKDDNHNVRPALEHPAMPILQALHEMALPNFMAHVTLELYYPQKFISSANYFDVMVTTLPVEKDPTKWPPHIVNDDRYLQVEQLIFICNIPFSDFSLRDKDGWIIFFQDQLNNIKQAALDRAKKAWRDYADILTAIGPRN